MTAEKDSHAPTAEYRRRGDLWWLVNRFLADRVATMPNGQSARYVRVMLARTLFDDDASWESCVAQTRDILRGLSWEKDEDLSAALQSDVVREVRLDSQNGVAPLSALPIVRDGNDCHLGEIPIGEEIELYSMRVYMRRTADSLTFRNEVATTSGPPLLNGRTHEESEALITELQFPDGEDVPATPEPAASIYARMARLCRRFR